MSATSRAKDDSLPIEPNAKRVVFCTGKVYYELDAKRETTGVESDVKIVRIEQLYRFRGTLWTGNCDGTRMRNPCGAKRNR